MTNFEAPSRESESPTSSLLRTLVLSDLVDSTALVERLGDREAAELIRKHDRLARTLADRHGGREIDKTDGFLMMFDRPVQAVAFALDYQRGLRQLNAAENSELSARVGIHVGDVVVWDNSSEDIAKGAKPVEVEGLVKPITSRLMSLALPGQILLSNIAYDLAHRAQGELGEMLESVRWRTHGRYRFRGVPDPVAVFEVGEEGLAPLKAPPWSSKAHREVPFWRRPATVVIEAIVVAALIAVPTVMFLRPDPAIAFASRDWVVVGSLHNLTGETVFDDALESALRIGLEQSRYVNVMPDLKVRDTITRMQRDPDKTEIDRAVGSEVAIRDGARALILPTIAEIGGRVRITAEVIDPQTQTTVYSETADGIGKESILPSLDTINSRLRVRLGEALATVSNESMPLEKVATKNLDALKTYSIGIRNNAKGRFAEALELYKRALDTDPGFASAQVRIGGVLLSAGRSAEAIESFEAALRHKDRLTPRDIQYTEALLANLRQQDDAFTKWSVLAETYPDYFAGTGAFAYLAWREANRFDKKILSLAESSASPQNSSRAPALHLLGILYLGNERFEDALRTFANAEELGVVRTEYHAATEAAQRKFGEAAATLASSAPVGASENPAASVARNVFEAAFSLDQGKFDSAKETIDDAQAGLPEGIAQSVSDTYEIGELVMALLVDPDTSRVRDRIRVALARNYSLRKAAAPAAARSMDARILALAYLAARSDDMESANGAMKLLRSESNAEFSADFKLREIVGAEVQRRTGDLDGAVRSLKALIDGSELFATHVSLMDAYAAADRTADALAEARWIFGHRGRAYAEHGAGNLLTLFNVANTTLGLLRGAELALKAGDPKLARELRDKFVALWPDAVKHPALSKRLAAIQVGLPPEASP